MEQDEPKTGARADDPRFQRSRDALLAAAETLFSQDAPGAVPVTRICAEAGVTRPTFYQHFPSVEALAQDAALARLGAIYPARAATPGSGDLIGEVQERVCGILNHLVENRTFFLGVVEAAGSAAFFEALLELVHERVLAGHFAGRDPDEAALIAAGMTWLVLRWLRAGGETPDELAGRIARLAGKFAG